MRPTWHLLVEGEITPGGLAHDYSASETAISRKGLSISVH
jgi:hypothetical protein